MWTSKQITSSMKTTRSLQCPSVRSPWPGPNRYNLIKSGESFPLFWSKLEQKKIVWLGGDPCMSERTQYRQSSLWRDRNYSARCRSDDEWPPSTWIPVCTCSTWQYLAVPAVPAWLPVITSHTRRMTALLYAVCIVCHFGLRRVSCNYIIYSTLRFCDLYL